MNSSSKPRILILGAAGMLGHAVFRYFSSLGDFITFGTLRSREKLHFFSEFDPGRVLSNIDVQNDCDILATFEEVRPDLVINCVGIIKQLDAAKNHLISLEINACLPHRLALYCQNANARLVHLSTDCVFSGREGMYDEGCFADADDLYGRSKLLGEVDYPHAITLRTSIIGHELSSAKSLVDWFLSQKKSVYGFNKAVFSGLPTVEIARVIHKYVIPNPHLCGLYHLSVAPINKFELLSLVAEIYGKQIELIPSNEIIIDRSLNSDRFRAATGFQPLPWRELVERMHQSYLSITRSKNV